MNTKNKSRLSFLDRFLTLWIFSAMALGIAVGYIFPNLSSWLSTLNVGTTSIPIAIGLIVMMYPPFAKIKYNQVSKITKNKKAMVTSIIASWVIGPTVMFLLSFIFLRNYPHYMVGLNLIGISTCVAMIIIWNSLADGDSEFAAAMIALNAIFQVCFYSVYVYLFITVFPTLFGLKGTVVHVSIKQIAMTVLFYLGVPFILGFLTKLILEKKKGSEWYSKKFVPKISPVALIALLYTIVLMFSLKGKYIVQLPMDTLRIALPMVLYFLIMFLLMFFICYQFKFEYKKSVSISMIASSNNFELAIAIAIAVFGIQSQEAFTAVIGPLIEVPVMISLVQLALFFKRKYFDKREVSQEISSQIKLK